MQYGSEVNGLIHSITQFLGVISFLELGIGQIIKSALYKPLSEKDNIQVSCIFVAGTKYFRKIACVLAVYSVLLMIVYPIITDQKFGWLYTSVLIGALSISSFSQHYFGIVERLLLNADQCGYIQYGFQIISLILRTGISVVLIRARVSIQIVKLSIALIQLLQPYVIHLYIERNYYINRKITYTEEPIKHKWSGIAQHLSAVVLDGTDTIVLTLFSSLTNISIYSVYHMIIYSMFQLYRAITAGLHAIVGNLWAKQELERLNRVFGYIETTLHFVVVFLFSCTWVLIIPFIRVYTDGISDADYIQPLFASLLVFAHGFQCLRSVYNMVILAGGHYKQTQSCHIIGAVINLVISIVTVKLWGLVGIGVGTLMALVYQTFWMAVYNSRHLMKWPLRSFVKHLAVDLFTAGVIVLSTSWIRWEINSFFEWFVMALLVALIASMVVIIIACLFFRERVTGILHVVYRRQKNNK